MSPGKTLLVVAFVVLAALAGAAAALSPVWMAAVPLVAVTLVLLVRRTLQRSLMSLIVLCIGLLHLMNLLRGSWATVLDPLREARVPLSILTLAVLVGFRPTLLLSRRGIGTIGMPLIYVAWLLVSGAFGINPAQTTFYAMWVGLLVIITGGAVGLARDPVDFWVEFMDMVRWTGLALVLLSLWHVAIGTPEARMTRWIRTTEVEGYSGFFLNPNLFGFVGTMTVGALLASSEAGPDEKPTLRTWALVLVAASAVFLATSRTGFLGITAGILYSQRREIRGVVRRASFRRIVGAVTAAGLALWGVWVVPLARGTITRLLLTPTSAAAGEEGRITIWGSFLRAYIDRPWFGIGFANSSGPIDFLAIRLKGSHQMDAHSTVISMLGTSGVLGTLLGGWMLVGALRGTVMPGAARYRASVAVFLATVGPYFLFETVGSGPGQAAAWPIWAVILTGRAHLNRRLPASEAHESGPSVPGLRLVRPLPSPVGQ